MRVRTIVSLAASFVLIGAATLSVRGATAAGPLKVCCVENHECCAGDAACCTALDKQWSTVNFVDTVMVNRKLVSGPVLIVHDDARMARGEPCTTFYRFDPAEGPKEELVSFHCTPRRARPVDRTTLTTVPGDLGIKRLIEYQIGGDAEAHGVPR